MNSMISISAAVAILVAGNSSSAQDSKSPEWPERRLKSVFKDLSEFARDVDSGARTLYRAHTREGQPDGMMTELRALVHEYPSLRRSALEYFRSKVEPLTGRVLAVLALAQPGNKDVADLMGTLVADPPDLKLGMAACMGYGCVPDERRVRSWRESLILLRSISERAGWRGGFEHDGLKVFHRSEAPDTLALNPLLDGLLELLKRNDLAELKTVGLNHALQLSKRKEFTEEDRGKVREAVNRSYLLRDEGWPLAVSHLAGRQEINGKPDFETLKRGFPGLDLRRQVEVLNEISRSSPESVFAPPFVDDFDKIIELLAQMPKESGLPLGTMFNYVHAIRLRTRIDGDLMKRLKGHPSSTLRQRLFLDD